MEFYGKYNRITWKTKSTNKIEIEIEINNIDIMTSN